MKIRIHKIYISILKTVGVKELKLTKIVKDSINAKKHN